jgi:flagellar hook-associated protein 1 FlgK
MLAAQRAYEAAARVMTTVDSVLDTLINRTGVR